MSPVEVTVSPPSPRSLAQAAYAAYGESTGHTNYQGLPMPEWEQLSDRIQSAWVEASSAAVQHHLAGLFGCRPTPDPSVGDIVLVAMDPAFNNGSAEAPAVVTRVWSKTTVNVRVLADHGASPQWFTSLVYAESLAEAAAAAATGVIPAVWTWPGGDS